jgi:iron complex outermembrane receptor protein
MIADQGGKVLDDVLRNVAGVMPGGYYQSWDYFRIRGFDASGTFIRMGCNSIPMSSSMSSFTGLNRWR